MQLTLQTHEVWRAHDLGFEGCAVIMLTDLTSTRVALCEKTEGTNQNLNMIVNSETPKNLELQVVQLADEMRPARCGQARRRSPSAFV